MHKSNPLLLAMVSGTLMSPGFAGQASHDPSDVVELDRIVLESRPPSNRRITDEDIRRHQPLDVADIFRSEVSVDVGGGSRNAQRLYLRGLEASNLNVNIDGAREGRNLHQHRGSLSGLDPDLIRQVEVDPRPSADQGPGALGGRVAFTTKDAQDLLLPDQQQGARMKAAYASADEAWLGSTSLMTRLNEDWGALAHLRAVNREDYRIGGGETMPHSGGQDRDYLLRLSRLPTQGQEIRLGAQRHTFTGDHPYGSRGSDFGDPREDQAQDEVGQRVRQHRWTLQHAYDAPRSWLDWNGRLYYTDHQLQRLDNDTRIRTREYGGDARNTFHLDHAGIQHRLTLGVDYYLEEGRTEGPSISSESRNLGAFIQNRMHRGRLSLSLGARFDDFSTEFHQQTLSGSAVSPNVSAEVALPAGLTAFAGYGEAVSGTGIIPVGWMAYINEDTNLNDGEPFKAEKSRRREAGVRYEARDALVDRDRLQLELTLFDTRLRNSVDRDDPWGSPFASRRCGFEPPFVGTIRNREDTLRTRGYEIRGSWGAGRYDTHISFFSAETLDEDGNPQAVSRRRGGTGGDRFVWDHRWAALDSLTLGYTFTWVDDLTQVPDDAPPRDGYSLHDLQAQWDPGLNDRLTLSLVIHNLLDTRYARHTSLADTDDDGRILVRDEPGRDIRVSATLRF
ncbi:TonB-dependent receptor domain-containing protein [Ectothiorhodospira haloalkaliphila]|uniref:TonB-dependent receptor domain-containing protein n=1 Tax=Ectothiorhodospira haloalkaliphila TaxID=421628 RepID=UPI0006867B2F|nr:TonB-dependent receptor [Ectothiorhodospira haloalkaliphila]